MYKSKTVTQLKYYLSIQSYHIHHFSPEQKKMNLFLLSRKLICNSAIALICMQGLNRPIYFDLKPIFTSAAK
jgi:hypothetical protein